MHKTIEKGLEVYKEELRKYQEAIDFAGDAGQLPFELTEDQLKLKEAELKGMAKALGLTNDEIKRIAEEVR